MEKPSGIDQINGWVQNCHENANLELTQINPLQFNKLEENVECFRSDEYKNIRNSAIWAFCGHEPADPQNDSEILFLEPYNCFGWAFNQTAENNPIIPKILSVSGATEPSTFDLAKMITECKVERMKELYSEDPLIGNRGNKPAKRQLPALEYALAVEKKIGNPKENPDPRKEIRKFAKDITGIKDLWEECVLDKCWEHGKNWEDEFHLLLCVSGLDYYAQRLKENDFLRSTFSYVSAGVAAAQIKTIRDRIMSDPQKNIIEELKEWKTFPKKEFFYPSYRVPLRAAHRSWKSGKITGRTFGEYIHYLETALEVYGFNNAPLLQEYGLILADSFRGSGITHGKYSDRLELLRGNSDDFPTKELYCRLGRIEKDGGDRIIEDDQSSLSEAFGYYKRALNQYRNAYMLEENDYYPAINVATCFFVVSSVKNDVASKECKDSAISWAKKTVRLCRHQLATNISNEERVWTSFSAAEAYLILNKWKKAKEEYERALSILSVQVSGPKMAQSAYNQVCRIYFFKDKKGQQNIRESIVKMFEMPPFDSDLTPGPLNNCDRQTLESRLFEQDTKHWFDNNESEVNGSRVRHNHWENNDDAWKKIKKYLDNFLTYEISDPWFNTHRDYIHDTLKHLLGANSSTQGNSKTNLTLGGVVLILASASKDNSQDWLETLILPGSSKQYEILPKQDHSQAKKTTLALYYFFEKLIHNKDTGEYTVTRVEIKKKKLKMELDIDGEDFINKILAKVPGDAVNWYFRFLERSKKAKTKDKNRTSIEYKSIINIEDLTQKGSPKCRVTIQAV